MSISVIILNWNGSAMLRKYLPSVVACTPDAEIIVADNGSTDDSLTLLAEQFPTVRVIILDKNYGFAEGYNRAIAAVDSEYVVLLNSDVEVTPHWLAPLAEYMRANPDVAACQPKLLSYTDKHAFEYAGAAGGYLDCFGYPFCRGRIFSTVETDSGQYDTNADIHWATGACLMVRRKVYVDCGGLDSRFFAHNEEIDLCWRIRLYGHRIVCVTQSAVYHLGGGTLPQGNPRKTFLNFRNNLLLLYKNMPSKELAHAMRVRLFLDYVAAFKFLLCGGWGDFRAVVKARREYRRMRREFARDRERNLEMTVVSQNAARPFLLWEYYVRGRKYFNLLK
jgi:GT2 family glycosyltransferase